MAAIALVGVMVVSCRQPTGSDSDDGENGLSQSSAPTAPSNLALGYEEAAGTVTLTWNAEEGAAGSVEIARRPDGESSWHDPHATADLAAQEYTEPHPDPAVAYFYRIRAVNDAGASKWLQLAPVGGPPAGSSAATAAPSEPTNVESSYDTASGEVAVTWGEPSDSGGTVEIARRAESDSNWPDPHETVPASDKSFSEPPPAGGTTYYYRVRVVTDAGASPWVELGPISIPAPRSSSPDRGGSEPPSDRTSPPQEDGGDSQPGGRPGGGDSGSGDDSGGAQPGRDPGGRPDAPPPDGTRNPPESTNPPPSDDDDTSDSGGSARPGRGPGGGRTGPGPTGTR